MIGFRDETFSRGLRDIAVESSRKGVPNVQNGIDYRWITGQPWVRLARNSNQLHTSSGNWQSVSWNQELESWAGPAIWDIANPTVVNLTTPGRWGISAAIEWAGAAAGNSRQIRVSHNVYGVVKRVVVRHGGNTLSQNCEIHCTAISDGTNFVTVNGLQDSGGNLNMQGSTDIATLFVQWLGPK